MCNNYVLSAVALPPMGSTCSPLPPVWPKQSVAPLEHQTSAKLLRHTATTTCACPGRSWTLMLTLGWLHTMLAREQCHLHLLCGTLKPQHFVAANACWCEPKLSCGTHCWDAWRVVENLATFCGVQKQVHVVGGCLGKARCLQALFSRSP